MKTAKIKTKNKGTKSIRRRIWDKNRIYANPELCQLARDRSVSFWVYEYRDEDEPDYTNEQLINLDTYESGIKSGVTFLTSYPEQEHEIINKYNLSLYATKYEKNRVTLRCIDQEGLIRDNALTQTAFFSEKFR